MNFNALDPDFPAKIDGPGQKTNVYFSPYKDLDLVNKTFMGLDMKRKPDPTFVNKFDQKYIFERSIRDKVRRMTNMNMKGRQDVATDLAQTFERTLE